MSAGGPRQRWPSTMKRQTEAMTSETCPGLAHHGGGRTGCAYCCAGKAKQTPGGPDICSPEDWHYCEFSCGSGHSPYGIGRVGRATGCWRAGHRPRPAASLQAHYNSKSIVVQPSMPAHFCCVAPRKIMDGISRNKPPAAPRAFVAW